MTHCNPFKMLAPHVTSEMTHKIQASISPLYFQIQAPTAATFTLNLPTFDGNILEWQLFWDSFDSAIHNTLTEVQKFNILNLDLV